MRREPWQAAHSDLLMLENRGQWASGTFKNQLVLTNLRSDDLFGGLKLTGMRTLYYLRKQHL